MATKSFFSSGDRPCTEDDLKRRNYEEKKSGEPSSAIGTNDPAKFDDLDQLSSSSNSSGRLTPSEERKLVRKIDILILSNLIICYIFFYLDKTTLSYAAIFGIRKDLHLEKMEYSWLSSLFYFGFLAWYYRTIPSFISQNRKRC